MLRVSLVNEVSVKSEVAATLMEPAPDKVTLPEHGFPLTVTVVVVGALLTVSQADVEPVE